jgi:hypothetical protein
MKKEVVFKLFSGVKDSSDGIQKFYSEVQLLKDFRNFKAGQKFAGAQFCVATSTLTLYEEEYGEIVRTHAYVLSFTPICTNKQKATKLFKKMILSKNNPINIIEYVEIFLKEKTNEEMPVQTSNM